MTSSYDVFYAKKMSNLAHRNDLLQSNCLLMLEKAVLEIGINVCKKYERNSSSKTKFSWAGGRNGSKMTNLNLVIFFLSKLM